LVGTDGVNQYSSLAVGDTAQVDPCTRAVASVTDQFTSDLRSKIPVINFL
jgi:hypothetical protein